MKQARMMMEPAATTAGLSPCNQSATFEHMPNNARVHAAG
jgi:hypothetical protein